MYWFIVSLSVLRALLWCVKNNIMNLECSLFVVCGTIWRACSTRCSPAPAMQILQPSCRSVGYTFTVNGFWVNVLRFYLFCGHLWTLCEGLNHLHRNLMSLEEVLSLFIYYFILLLCIYYLTYLLFLMIFYCIWMSLW